MEEDFQHDIAQDQYEINEGDLAFLEQAPQTVQAQSTPVRRHLAPMSQLSPIIRPHTTPDFVLLPTTRNVPPGLSNRVEPTWRPKPISVKKFVDDNLQNEKLFMKKIPLMIDGPDVYKNARAGQSEAMFNHIGRRAKNQGLKVNTQKTTVLAISNAVSYEARAHLYDEQGARIDSTSSLKALGFIFNTEGDVKDQVESLCKRFRTRTWALRDLKKSGFSESELISVYKSTIRPVIEYSAVIYHSMLTAELSYYIEKQQFRALKNIYGNQYSHGRLLELSNLPTLEQRRIEASVRFANKMANNPRFQHHFKKKRSRARAKTDKEYIEMTARTNRRKNSPLFSFRRLLNNATVHYD